MPSATLHVSFYRPRLARGIQRRLIITVANSFDDDRASLLASSPPHAAEQRHSAMRISYAARAEPFSVASALLLRVPCVGLVCLRGKTVTVRSSSAQLTCGITPIVNEALRNDARSCSADGRHSRTKVFLSVYLFFIFFIRQQYFCPTCAVPDDCPLVR